MYPPWVRAQLVRLTRDHLCFAESGGVLEAGGDSTTEAKFPSPCRICPWCDAINSATAMTCRVCGGRLVDFTYTDERIQAGCEPEMRWTDPDTHRKGSTGEEGNPPQVPPGLKRKCTRCGHYNDGNAFSCTKCQQALYRKFDERGGGPVWRASADRPAECASGALE